MVDSGTAEHAPQTPLACICVNSPHHVEHDTVSGNSGREGELQPCVLTSSFAAADGVRDSGLAAAQQHPKSVYPGWCGRHQLVQALTL